MKVIVGAALALGVVLGGGQTLAANLVADDVTSVDEPTTPPDGDTEPTDPTTDPGDSDGDTTDADTSDEGTEDSADVEGDDAAGETGDDAAEAPAAINYGQLVKAWLVCSKADAPVEDPAVEPVDPTVDPAEEPAGETVVDCGARPHPPGVATGFDAAHAKDHSAHGSKTHVKPDHAAKHGDTAHGRGHGKRS